MMRIKNFPTYVVILSFTFLTFLISGCGFFDKDNTPPPTPLTQFSPEIKPHLLWSSRTGSGNNDGYLKMNPAATGTAIITASSNGTITSINKQNGNLNWQRSTLFAVSAGPGIGDGIIVIGGRKGEVVALSQIDGRILWHSSVPGEILSNPAVSNGRVVIKTVDGYIRGLSIKDGQLLWAFQQVEPNLVLRGASAPLIRDRYIIAGFANGNLAKLNLDDGQMIWLQTIAVPEGAFAIQRMIDIDANPLVFEHDIYAATYQGKIASLDWASGKVLWDHTISSYTGMTADENTVYLSDARSFIWAFGANNGFVKWRQTQLEARTVSAPVTMSRYVVVGDGLGYLHWLDKIDGHFAARVKVGGPIYATPLVENNVLYVLANDGRLSSYVLSR